METETLGAGRPDYPVPGRVERALDLLFPPVCVGCRRVGRWICAECWLRVLWLGTGQDDLVPRGSHLDRVVAAAMFEGVAREAVHALKFEGRYAIANTLGKLMARRVGSIPADLLVPVPLHSSRRRERGFDQAALLTRRMAVPLRVPTGLGALRRTRKTQHQTTLDRGDRRENMRGAFAAQVSLAGETILLVDDVYTTGATMDEAAGALCDAGAAKVVGVVFARAD